MPKRSKMCQATSVVCTERFQTILVGDAMLSKELAIA